VALLTVNAGSSSLKLALLDDADQVVQSTTMRTEGEGIDRDALDQLLRGWPRPEAICHRIVHGGSRYVRPVRIDENVRQELRDLADLAPLHQGNSLAALAAVDQALPGVPAFACFDTAFHASMPEAAKTYAVPEDWRQRLGVRRYGFHGLSHGYAARRAAELLSAGAARRLVSCHLGAGASLAAVLDGKSVDTTMGFTPLEGLVMATRSGSIDPGALVWLEQHADLAVDDLDTALEHHSGLLALAGSADMQTVESRAAQGDDAAKLAFDVYIHRLLAGIGAMAAAAGGVDALIFTGGVGEHSAPVRAAASEALAWLGVAINPAANEKASGDADITHDNARVRTLVIAAREDLQMAYQLRTLQAQPD
jgi:acetate kinase